MAAAAVILAIYGVQVLLSNRPGSEMTVKALTTTTRPVAWPFVALEYYYGILNRSYLIFVTDRMICGAKVRGLLAAPIQVGERWRDPLFYPRPGLVAKYEGIDLESSAFKSLDGANFQIRREDVSGVAFSAEPKWGMGTVPYSGRLFLALRDGTRRELILLGTQNGTALRDRLVNAGFGRAAA